MLKREKHFPSCFPPLLILFMKTYTICYGCYGWCRPLNSLCMLDLHMCLECLMDSKLRSTELICCLNSGLSVSWQLKSRSTELIWSLTQKIRILITLSPSKHSGIMIVWLSNCQTFASTSFTPMSQLLWYGNVLCPMSKEKQTLMPATNPSFCNGVLYERYSRATETQSLWG